MRTALVTGASRGIGAEISKLLISEGCRVLTPSRQELDLASNLSINSYLKSIDFNIDILVNNAGINHIANFEGITAAELMETFQINLFASFQLAQALVPDMRKNKYGRVVNISSIWSIVSKAGRISYGMSKDALNGMTRMLAIEVASDNILINSVAPGYVMTDLTRQNNSQTELETISQKIPLKRLAEPIEIARVVAFLCSESNSYITGQTIIVDGGYTCL